jgi:hypothetical protein
MTLFSFLGLGGIALATHAEKPLEIVIKGRVGPTALVLVVHCKGCTHARVRDEVHRVRHWA